MTLWHNAAFDLPALGVVTFEEDAEPEWRSGDPPRIGRYFCCVDMGTGKAHEQRGFWDDGWTFYGIKLQDDWKVTGWWPLPKEDP